MNIHSGKTPFLTILYRVLSSFLVKKSRKSKKIASQDRIKPFREKQNEEKGVWKIFPFFSTPFLRQD